MGTREYPWASNYPYRDTRMGMGMGTSTIFIQQGGDRYNTTRTHGYPLTFLIAVPHKLMCGYCQTNSQARNTTKFTWTRLRHTENSRKKIRQTGKLQQQQGTQQKQELTAQTPQCYLFRALKVKYYK